MAYDNRRTERVAEAIREEVARFLADGVKDPRVRGLVTVTGVEVTRDLRHAKVFVSIMGEEAEREETFAGLEGVAAHLRGHVGRVLRLRAAPELHFKHDASVGYAARIETLLQQVRRESEAGAGTGADEGSSAGASPDGASDGGESAGSGADARPPA